MPSGSNENEAAAIQAECADHPGEAEHADSGCAKCRAETAALEAGTGWYVVYHNRLYDDVALPEPQGPYPDRQRAQWLADQYNQLPNPRYKAGVMHGTMQRTGPEPDAVQLYLRLEGPAPPTPAQLAWQQVQEHLDAYGSAYIVRKPNGCYELQDPTQYKVVPRAG